MNDLSNEQRIKLSITLMEYLNAGNWKELFEDTDCEEFAKQHTKFYEDNIWENDTLEQDCNDAVEHILSKDSANLKIIWLLEGVAAISKRNDAKFYSEVEAMLEADMLASATGVSTNSSINPYDFDTSHSQYKALDDSEALLNSQTESNAEVLTEATVKAYKLMYAALYGFLRQACSNKGISYDASDSIFTLMSKVNDDIKGQTVFGQNINTLSLLRVAGLLIATIDDLTNQQSNSDFDNAGQNQASLNTVDVKFAINLSRSTMRYIDGLVVNIQ